MPISKVEIIESQSEEIKPLNISREEEELMIQNFLKGGSIKHHPIPKKRGETFEEMCRRHEEEMRSRKSNKHRDGLNREEKIVGDGESGLNFRIKIESDMKL